ncbi:MAG: UvrD family DEAD/DEAH box helicase [Deltaproteobacteria bacterium]|nr:UvrD family DEAD/DEAH box helicase [Deltaproteobacteria bacterium]
MINLYFKNFNFNLSNFIGIAIFSEDKKKSFIKNLINLELDYNVISFIKMKSSLRLYNKNKISRPLSFPLKYIEELFSSKFIILEDLFIENLTDAVLFNAICDFVLHNKIILCPVIADNFDLQRIYDNFNKNFYEDLIIDIFKLRLGLLTATRIIYDRSSEFVTAITYIIKKISELGFLHHGLNRQSPFGNPCLKFMGKDNFTIMLRIHPLKKIIAVRDEFIGDSKIMLNISFNDIYFNPDEIINKIKIFPVIIRDIKNVSNNKKTVKFKYDKLSKIQDISIKELNSAHLVIAGAGSGKTRLIVNKFLYLMNFMSPGEILVLTYTNNAADEIKSRIGRLCTGDNLNIKKILNITTYHSFFYSIIREYYLELGFKSVPLVKEQACENIKTGFISYDDMILNVLKLFKNKNIVYDIASRFKYILVDEYQDLDFLSDIIIKKIDGGRGITMYAGDDDQSIYGFNGGDSANLLFFDLFYSSGKLFIMQYNYRSNSKIINFCNSLLNNINFRFPKKMIQSEGNNMLPDENAVDILSFESKNSEERFIIGRFNLYLAMGENVGVLVRTQKEEDNFKKILKEMNPEGYANSKNWFIGTIHKSKGMEFDTVFIANANNGNIPHLKSLTQAYSKNKKSKNLNHPFQFFLNNDINGNSAYEDEIKLFYVAVSRAKKKVFITYSGKKSEFLA